MRRHLCDEKPTTYHSHGYSAHGSCAMPVRHAVPFRVLCIVALLMLGSFPQPATGYNGATAKNSDPGEDFKYYSRLFLSCLDNCLVKGCAHVTHKDVDFTTGGCVPLCALDGSKLEPGEYPPEFTLPMRWTGWDCASDCKYRCTRTVVNVRQHEGLNTAKYYGKWSFERILGVQEFISMAASVANAAVHVWLLPELFRAAFGMRDANKNKNKNVNRGWAFLWFTNGVTQTHGWFWSAVFHTRDTPWTHLMDYGSANLIFFVGVFCAVVRVFEVKQKRKIFILFVLFLATNVAHLLHVNRSQTDGTKYHFKFNMRVMIGMAVVHWVLMLRWAFGGLGKQRGKSKGSEGDDSVAKNSKRKTHLHPGRFYLAKCCFFWHVCALWEVLDFPPVYGVLDAHALWHCGTPPTVWLWYQFIRTDVGLLEEPEKEKRAENKIN